MASTCTGSLKKVFSMEVYETDDSLRVASNGAGTVEAFLTLFKECCNIAIREKDTIFSKNDIHRFYSIIETITELNYKLNEII